MPASILQDALVAKTTLSFNALLEQAYPTPYPATPSKLSYGIDSLSTPFNRLN
ncbi:hypothetical protein [Vibrio mediterranei]|uniref:hypothetical protein n=1 Tax=Vibrio mediterranei TaxID=689 RepID=UPI0013EF6CDD|nr:hypothetical protein [Vibrio mediterranei]